ncbi:uncharacterized protein LOC141710490 [Apium graveolens]|uniref:uncharacterized protein LOC141710490 n=1 Tax=Apium graveolens TaxID=4045 RepID=UPI003D7AA2C8
MEQTDLGKLFVGGISWDTSEERLKEYFSTYGEVLDTVIMKDRKTGRARGFGFIIFADPIVADLVIQKRHYIDGKMVETKKAISLDAEANTISRHSASIQCFPVPIHTRKIFVGGLASSVTESEFKLYFEKFGTVTDSVVMYDHDMRRPKGFGFITYDSEDAVDKVLLKTFHELHDKMVEVKRAVPKDLSPIPNKNLPGGDNYCLGRIDNFLDSYNQGYLPRAADKHGVGMGGKLSHITSKRNVFTPISSNFGMGLNVEGKMDPNFAESANFGNSINNGKSMSLYFHNNSNRFTNSMGFDGETGGDSSFFSSHTRSLWSNMGPNTTNSRRYMGYKAGTFGGVNFENTRLGCESSPILSTGRERRTLSNQGENLVNGGVHNNYNLDEDYGRNIITTVAPTSSYDASTGGYNVVFEDLHASSSVYADNTCRIADSEREETDVFGYGLGTRVNDIQFKHSPDYIGGYKQGRKKQRN